MSKCRSCKTNESVHTWQPFGPDDSILCFTRPGYHYRGFPAIGICEDCKNNVENGNPGVIFTYKKTGYYALDHQVKETPF